MSTELVRFAILRVNPQPMFFDHEPFGTIHGDHSWTAVLTLSVVLFGY